MRNRRPIARSSLISSLILLAAVALLALAGCASDETEPTDSAKVNTLLADGDYFLGTWLKVGPVKPSFKLSVKAEGTAGEGGTLTQVQLRGLDYTGQDTSWASEVVATAVDIAVAADGSFTIDFGLLDVPAKSTPVGKVAARLKLEGHIKDGSMCGDLGGEIEVGDWIPLAGSTFKAVLWGEQKTPFEYGCVAQQVQEFEHIASCPTIQVGANSMVSAKQERQFEVMLPAGATPTAKLPVVFLFHGVGGSRQGILDDSGFPDLLKTDDFILVAPDSARKDGKKIRDLDWRFTAESFDMDNADLVFFDDLLSCLDETWPVDSSRVYVTGMSGGGLVSAFLAANRSENIAAAAPMSGGYFHAWPDLKNKMPAMVGWGGPTDQSHQQDFHDFSTKLVASLKEAGHSPLVICEHDKGHKWPAGITPAIWAFLSEFTLGGKEAPYKAGDALPALFPSYCKL